MTQPLWEAFIGGILIGIAATVMLLFNGRITGNSGIIGGLWTIRKDKQHWRMFYAAGLIIGAGIYGSLHPGPVPLVINAPVPALIIAGFLVGYGTRLGSGCTAGHGVCGIARLSKRSIAATLIFMSTAVVTVWIVKQF